MTLLARVEPERLLSLGASCSSCDKIFWIICLHNNFRVIGFSKENLSSGSSIFMLEDSKSDSTFINSEMWIVQVVKSICKNKRGDGSEFSNIFSPGLEQDFKASFKAPRLVITHVMYLKNFGSEPAVNKKKKRNI